MKTPAIGIYGMAGSGKTTLGLRIAEYTGLTYISFGQVIRDNHDVFNGSVNISKAIEILNRYDGIVISGFPVRVTEYYQFVKAFDLYRTFHLLLPEDVARERFFSRRRTFDDEKYFTDRLKLYREVIMPFTTWLNTVIIDGYANDADAVFAIAKQYM